MSPEQLVCYQTKRQTKATSFEREDVSINGQIAGGLSSFMQAELEDIKSFLNVK
jgi:hypothetical protein